MCRQIRLKDGKLIKRGLAQVGNSLDVVTLVRTQKRLGALERFFFSRQQRTLLKMNTRNFLSVVSDSTSDSEYPKIEKLAGY